MKSKNKKRSKKRRYTHVDAYGVKWRFDGARPVSQLADRIMSAADLREL